MQEVFLSVTKKPESYLWQQPSQSKKKKSHCLNLISQRHSPPLYLWPSIVRALTLTRLTSEESSDTG